MSAYHVCVAYITKLPEYAVMILPEVGYCTKLPGIRGEGCLHHLDLGTVPMSAYHVCVAYITKLPEYAVMILPEVGYCTKLPGASTLHPAI